MNNIPTSQTVTLENIVQRTAQLKKELDQQKEVMTNLTRHMLTPFIPTTTKAGAMMRAFNTGMAIFDGIVLGIKLMKRFRRSFR